ncbi:MAG TPA: hypothetical protein PKY82_27295 [Pyrinomonadaceae bacterium]|nr:hypothetical protein [Pyrinomonadaceae bacterium]
MEIRQETENKIVVGMVKSYVGTIFFAMSFFIILIGVFAAAEAQPRAGGMSRTPSGGGYLAVTLVPAILVYFDWRRNRKELTMDSKERTMTIVGSQNQKYSLDEIQSFCLGAGNYLGKTVSQIDLQLKNGQRVSSGINSHRGDAETAEKIMQKLSDRLKAASAQS